MTRPDDLDARRRAGLALDLERIAADLDHELRWPYSAARLREAARIIREGTHDHR